MVVLQSAPGWEAEHEEPPAPSRVGTLTIAALVPPLAGYLGVAGLLALVLATAARAKVSAPAAFGAAVPGWLAACHIPVRIKGAPLGMLPLLPTVLVMLLAAAAAAYSARRLGLTEPEQAGPVVLTISCAHAIFGAVLAVAVSVGPVTVSPALAFFGCGVVGGLAAVAGLAMPCGLIRHVRDRLDPVVAAGIRAGLLGAGALFASGAAVTAVGLVLSWRSTGRLFGAMGPDLGSEFGAFLLSVGYLPNAVVCGLSFLAGPGFSFGMSTMSPFGVTGGPLPQLPLLAALPAGHSRWLALVILVPMAVGAAVGWTVRASAEEPIVRLRVAGVAAGVVACCAFLLATVSGGRLGTSMFDPVSVPAGLLAIASFCWIAVPAGVTAWFCGTRDTLAEEID